MSDYLQFAQDIAQQAGKIMLEHFHVAAGERQTKSDGSIVTLADRKINALVIKNVVARFPDHAVLGEEQSLARQSPAFTWVCDPVDGSLPYALGVPTNVFSLALVDTSGLPQVAVVCDPYLHRTYWAEKSRGAYMNGVSIRVNDVASLESAVIGGSGKTSPFLYAELFKRELLESCYKPLTLQSVIYEAVLVATGGLAATVIMGNGAHDAASAKLIVEEAGGRVTNLFGDGQRYDRSIQGAIISNGRVHAPIVDLAKQHQL